MKLSTEHLDSKRGRSPSDDVKQGDLTIGDGELLSDPDAQLGPDDRAAIVYRISFRPSCPFILCITG